MVSKIPHSKEKFIETMEKGFPWKERCRLTEDWILWHLMERAQGRVCRRGDVTRGILAGYGWAEADKRNNPYYEPLANTIGHLAKQDEFEHLIKRGKDIKCGKHKDGRDRYVPERLWFNSEYDPDSDEGSIELAEEEVSNIIYGPDNSPQKGWGRTGLGDKKVKPVMEFSDRIAAAGPGQFVECTKKELDDHIRMTKNAIPVDTPEFSRQPKPGYTLVTCGQCGGTGRVYMKQEKSDDR